MVVREGVARGPWVYVSSGPAQAGAGAMCGPATTRSGDGGSIARQPSDTSHEPHGQLQRDGCPIITAAGATRKASRTFLC